MMHAADYYDEFDDMDDYYLFDEFEDDDLFDAYDSFDEDDEFLGKAWNWLTKKGSTQRRVALSAAKNALTGGGGAIGGTLATIGGLGPWGTAAGITGGSLLGGAAAGLLPDQMDYLAEMAYATEDEDEAEAFLGALVPLAAKLLPRLGGAVSRVTPQLISGVSRVGKTLRRHPATRSMIRSLPGIVRNTTRDVARHYSKHGTVTGKQAAKYLARRTYQGLSRPTASRKRLSGSALPVRGHPMPVKRPVRTRIIRGPGGYCRCYYQ
ncbi:hypothetical protein [Methylomonas sp. MgM2]